MALENLKENINIEKEIIKEISLINSQVSNPERYDIKKEDMPLINQTLKSLIKQLKIVNNSIPNILNSISGFRNLPSSDKEAALDLVKLQYTPKEKNKRISITINKKDKELFLKELSVSSETLNRIRKKKKEKVESSQFEFKKSGTYSVISNKFFLKTSNKLIEKGYFKRLNVDLRKANIPFLLTTYISIILLTTVLSFLAGTFIFIVLLFIDVVLAFKFSFIIIVFPLLAFLSLYFYPYAERRNIGSRIDNEIPFVAIHMSAIAGSGIEPTQIFKIIASGEEYPYTKTEMKKIINQVNLYGYDLVTALENVARKTSSKKFSELLNGMSATISSGGSLSEFFDKRAETLTFDYKLSREKYTKSAETFMDIYISIMVAAPMILTLLLVLISISGISIGLSLNMMTVVIVSSVALINIIFLMVLQLKQPNY